MMHFEDELHREVVRWNFRELRERGVSILTRMLLRLSPPLGMRRLAHEVYDLDLARAEKLHRAFFCTQRIDVVPSNSGTRGFRIIVDRTICLCFYQDSDHFAYDGFEHGTYEKGEVRVFDER